MSEPRTLTEHEELLSRLLFEVGERLHSTHGGSDSIVSCQTGSLCQRIMAALLYVMPGAE